jgi:hypothetical protein
LPHSFRPRSATLVIILWNTSAIATSEVNTDLGQGLSVARLKVAPNSS